MRILHCQAETSCMGGPGPLRHVQSRRRTGGQIKRSCLSRRRLSPSPLARPPPPSTAAHAAEQSSTAAAAQTLSPPSPRSEFQSSQVVKKVHLSDSKLKADAILVAGSRPTATLNSPFSSTAVAITVDNTQCVYPRRDGQVEWARVAGYITRLFTCPKAVTHPTTNRAQRIQQLCGSSPTRYHYAKPPLTHRVPLSYHLFCHIVIFHFDRQEAWLSLTKKPSRSACFSWDNSKSDGRIAIFRWHSVAG